VALKVTQTPPDKATINPKWTLQNTGGRNFAALTSRSPYTPRTFGWHKASTIIQNDQEEQEKEGF
jgi:hypothetical protein